MKVLMISGDPAVLDPKSETGKRMEEYRQVLGGPASPSQGGLDILLCRGNILNFFSGFFRGLKIMRQKGFDVITAQDVERSFLAWLLSKKFDIPWQMQIHTDIFSPYFAAGSFLNKIRVLLARFLLPRANCVRVVSERIKNSILRTSNVLVDVQRPIITLPIFVDVEKIHNAPVQTDLHEKYGKDKFIILMASRITKEKNIGLATGVLEAVKAQVLQDLAQRDGASRAIRQQANMRVFAKLSAKAPLLLIVGDGPELESLKSKVKSKKLEENVKFEPYTEDLASYYKTCDLFLLTSNYEGYGRTLVEAAAAGAKIISSDVGIASEILEPENIFKVADGEGLKAKLEGAISGKIKPAKLLSTQTKEEYLKLYKKSLESCL